MTRTDESCDVDNVGAAGVAVDLRFETLLVAVADGGVEAAPFSSPAVSTASCTSIATLSFTVAASTAAVLLPVRFPPVVSALLHVVALRAFVSVVTVLTAVEALNPAGVTLRMHGHPAARARFRHEEERAKLSA